MRADGSEAFAYRYAYTGPLTSCKLSALQPGTAYLFRRGPSRHLVRLGLYIRFTEGTQMQRGHGVRSMLWLLRNSIDSSVLPSACCSYILDL